VLRHDVFEEPESVNAGPSESYGDFIRHSGTPEAVRARLEINGSYSRFPDKAGQVLGNLRGDSERQMFQALDELRVRDLINPDYEVRYEEVIAAPAMIILTMTLSRGQARRSR
jgi:hypothetical protein